MLLWSLITASALAAMLAIPLVYAFKVHRHPSVLARKQKPGICIYLDEDNAMDLYLQGDYPYLHSTVVKTSRRNIVLGLLLRFLPFLANVQHTAAEEQVIKYFEEVGPITVIGRIVRALNDADDIVHVDLLNHTICPNADLERTLGPSRGKQPRSARLRDLESDTFVSVMGRFKVTDKSEKATTFSAPYGGSSADSPTVSVTCITKHLRRDDTPDLAFRARCLGKINWDPTTGHLKIYPVLAIFQ
ncbi:hypothetical protein [Actinomadura macra]|uniref:hypothetical protein n=1 Tax=Actinomadura macra TaxID=46164 RepID=UPI00083009A9|nr:hypothetical protein [Actinomadura macra]